MEEKVEQRMWVEKYRPQSLNDIIGQEINIKSFKASVAAKNIMHLLFSGPAGTGKTASAHAIAKDLYGIHWKRNFEEFNASDARGIDDMRALKAKASTMPVGDVPFKIIFLDESDLLTGPAQGALRRIMEKYEKTCRFILSCNFQNRLIAPIQSRCSIFWFGQLTEQNLLTLINKIVDAENLTMDDAAKMELISLTKGDTRNLINTLQISAQLDKTITKDSIIRSTRIPDTSIVESMFNFAIKGDFESARSTLMNEFINQGFDSQSIINAMEIVLTNNFKDLDPVIRLKLYTKIYEVDANLQQSATPHIQLAHILAAASLLTKIPVTCVRRTEY